MRTVRVVAVGIALALSASVLAGCGSSSKSGSSTTTTESSGGVTVPSGSGTSINVTVSDTKGLSAKMTMVVAPATAPAGDVTFVVKNSGTIDHEVVVLKSDTAYDKLPVTYAGDPPAKVASGGDKVGEDSSVGETNADVKPGETSSFTITNMAAGKYVLVCNIAKHYGLGMRAPFTVTAS